MAVLIADELRPALITKGGKSPGIIVAIVDHAARALHSLEPARAHGVGAG